MKFMSNVARKAFVLLSASFLLITSCKEQVKPLEPDDDVEVPQVADSLNNVFVKQVAAMRTLVMESSVSVTSCELKSDGLYHIKLNNGATFVSYPEDVDYYTLLSYVKDGDEFFWALQEKDGSAKPMMSDADKKVNMSAEMLLSLSDNSYRIDVNGLEFATSFVQEDVFQGFRCYFHKDASSEVYAVTFDFGQDVEKTYFVMDYTNIGFRLPYGESTDYITSCFVNSSHASPVIFDIPDGVEYEVVASEGWAAAVRKEDGVTYIDIIAPARNDSGNVGQLDVMLKDSDISLAQLSLTDSPFSAVFASATDAVVNVSVGVRKFVYGLSVVEDFDEGDVVSVAESVVTGSAAPAGCGVSETSVSVAFTQLLGAELDPDKRYVLWAVPALYMYGEDAGYYIDPSTLHKYEFGAMSFSIETVEARLLDADIKVTARGADAVFGGVIAKSEEALTDVLFQLENSILDSIPVTDQQFVYEGLLSDYPAVDAERNEVLPATTYYVWVAPAFTGDYTYSEKDIFFTEVSTNDLVEGGAVSTVLGSAVVKPSTITVPVEAKGATMIYYAFLNNSTGRLYAGDDVPNVDKFKQIMDNSPVATKGESVSAAAVKLNPSTTYWLYAVAVDEDGKYGQVVCTSAKTTALVYDTSISLSVESLQITAKKIVYKVTSDGGDLSDYVYWVGRKTDPFWANTTYCGGSKLTAQKYIALNPEDDNITKVMNKYGQLASDGTITIDGLTMETEYVFVILEKGETNYSQAGYLMVKTLAAELGDVVKEGTDTWNQARETVNIEWIESRFHQAASGNLMSSYAFNFKCPDNLTAYVMCGSDNYFESAGITKTEHIMIEIENYSSRKYENGRTPMINGELACEPDYYKNGELCSGQLMNVSEYYVHGLPDIGFVTYFAKGSHGEGNCIYWENGQCVRYEMQKASIARYLTLEPYLAKAAMFGLEGAEADAWAQALLDAYTPYYKDAKPVIYENDGNGVVVSNPYATGLNDEGVVPDRVIVMLKDLQGNYYEPMYFEVPNYFED